LGFAEFGLAGADLIVDGHSSASCSMSHGQDFIPRKPTSEPLGSGAGGAIARPRDGVRRGVCEGGPGSNDPGRFTCNSVSLAWLIRDAYQFPAWMSTAQFDFEDQEMQVYGLTVTKGGAKLKESAGPDQENAEPERMGMDADGFPILPAGNGPIEWLLNGRVSVRWRKMGMN
jgi:hypothetical protein